MANIDSPSGFRPFSCKPKINTRNQRYVIQTVGTAYATSIFPGDPLVMLDDGTIGRAAASASGPIIGVCAGVNYIDSNGVPQWGYWPASTVVKTGTVAEILIYDDPDEVFVVQADGSLAATDVGLLATTIYTHAGSTLYNRSGAEIQSSSANTAADQWRIMGLALKTEGKEANEWGTNVDVLVTNAIYQGGPGVVVIGI